MGQWITSGNVVRSRGLGDPGTSHLRTVGVSPTPDQIPGLEHRTHNIETHKECDHRPHNTEHRVLHEVSNEVSRRARGFSQ